MTVQQALHERHSGRAYDPDYKISDEIVHKLVEAARVTPSCYNDQPWVFIITDKERTPEGYQKVLDSLAEGNREWAKDAPVLIAAIANTRFKRNDKLNRWGPYDLGAASFAMALAAHELGLMAHQMGGFDEEKLAESFSLPKTLVPYAVMAVGREKAGSKPGEKDRLPISELFHFGDYPAGIKG